jgi:site-specific recombinase XerC
MASTRHTSANHLSRASGGDLEGIQVQLGHASIETTAKCSMVTKEEKARAADALAKAHRRSQRNWESGASRSRRVLVNSGLEEESIASS